VHHTALEVL